LPRVATLFPTKQADEAALEKTLLRTLQGHIVAVGQVIVLPWTGCTVVARITAADTLNAAAQQVLTALLMRMYNTGLQKSCKLQRSVHSMKINQCS
jgi:hypothetical protein